MSIIGVTSAVVVCAATLVVGVPGSSDAAPPRAFTRVCAPIVASGVGQDLGGGQTTATISSHGVRLGTSTATFTTTGLNGTVASFAGDIVIATAVGALTVPVTGTLDVTTGAFSSSSTTVTGSGVLSSVSGALTFTGVENLTTGAFTETVKGRLCSSIS
ncbi:MAG: hypothetical protein ABIQ53_12710 [Terracoccus sp.]